jgi:hypothetical protein
VYHVRRRTAKELHIAHRCGCGGLCVARDILYRHVAKSLYALVRYVHGRGNQVEASGNT